MTPTELARARLTAQALVNTPHRTPLEVVRALLAVQAQDFRASLWAVGQRIPAATEAGVEAALTERSVVRTWPLRGTLHLVAATDVRWLLGLTAQKTIRGARTRHAQLGLDDRLFARARRVLEKALGDGAALSRPAVYALLEREKISAMNQRGIHVLWRLAHEGVLCFGPREGKQPTFVLLDAWVPPEPARARDEALHELALRYFVGHGPASERDFAWWSGLDAADARRAVESIRGECEVLEVEGRPVLVLGERPALASARVAHLLPAFDELIVGYAERSALGPPEQLAHVIRGGLLGPALTIGGRSLGRWTRRLSARAVEVAFEPLGALPPVARRALETAAGRYAAFLELALRLPKA